MALQITDTKRIMYSRALAADGIRVAVLTGNVNETQGGSYGTNCNILNKDAYEANKDEIEAAQAEFEAMVREMANSVENTDTTVTSEAETATEAKSKTKASKG